MDRRAYTREPLSLSATVVQAGVSEYRARIQDFSDGGLFIVIDTATNFETNDSIQIQFDSDGRYLLRARVAGQFNGGYGCEFFDPDPTALTALRATSGEKLSPTGAPARANTAVISQKHKALINDCKQLFSEFLEPKSTELFTHTEHALFILARDATSNEEQNRFDDAIREIEQFKAPVQEHFATLLVQQMDSLGDALEASNEPSEAQQSTSQLALVESGQFADWLATKQIHSRAEARVEEAIYKLNARLSELAAARVDDDNNPLGLAAICHTFHDALQHIAGARLVRQTILEAFDEVIIGNLEPFYDELNKKLEDAGVLPGIEKPLPAVTKQAHESADDSTGAPGPGPEPDYPPAAATPPISHVQNPAVAGSPATPPPSYSDTAQNSGSGYAQQAPAQAFQQQSPENPRTGVAQQPPTTLAPNDPTSPALQHTPTLEPPSNDESTAFGEQADLAPHPSLSTGVAFNPQAVASQPVYRGAAPIASRAFGAAQSLMGIRQQVAEANIPPSAALPSYEMEQVQGALSLLQSQDSNDPNASASGVTLKERVLRALRSRHGYADKKEIPQAQSQAIDMIAELVTSIVEDELVTTLVKPSIQRLEVPMLNTALSDPAFFESNDHPARQVVDQLARIPESRNALVKARTRETIEGIVDQLVQGVRESPEAYQEALEQLQGFSEERLRVRSANLKALVENCEKNQRQIHQQATKDDPESAQTDYEWQSWHDSAKRLQVGDAVLLNKDSGHPQQAALAWVGEDQATFVFSDVDGLKTETLSLHALASRLRTGSTEVIHESELPATDRGLYSMLRKLHDQVSAQANVDRLTQLLNQRELESRVSSIIEKSCADGSSHALCYLDLDHFHKINEKCGRRSGDRLLQEISKALLKRLGAEDVMARLIEDKFGVLLANLDTEQAFAAAEKQRQRIERFKIAFKGERLSITASLGLCTIDANTRSAQSVFSQAEKACEQAKRNGGNRIVRHQVDTSEAADAPDDSQSIVATIDKGELHLRCQKIAPLNETTDEKPYYEVLLGLNDSGAGSLTPSEFIQSAEHCGEIVSVDRWVLDSTFRWMTENKRRLLKLGGLSINLSAQSLSSHETLAYVLELFNSSRLPPRKVLFEVSENEAISSLSNAENFIRVMGEYGCRFILDDFGNGSTSYSYLKHLPIDYVKIDGMFVKDMANNVNDHAMVKSINEIGHFMDKQTVAEFVETAEIATMLREIGIDFAQGYGIEKPILLNDLR